MKNLKRQIPRYRLICPKHRKRMRHFWNGLAIVWWCQYCTKKTQWPKKKEKKLKLKRIVRKFTVDEEQGAAALFVGSTAEGLPLRFMDRTGTKVVAIYEGRK